MKQKIDTTIFEERQSGTVWADLSVPSEVAKAPGGTLICMLFEAAHKKGHKMADIGKELEVSYGYIAQLRSGQKRADRISREFAAKCAAYLGVPIMTVMLAADKITTEDLTVSPAKLATSVRSAMEYIRRDPEFGALGGVEFSQMPIQVQFTLVKLYEKASGLKLLPGIATKEELAREMEETRQLYERYRTAELSEAEAA